VAIVEEIGLVAKWAWMSLFYDCLNSGFFFWHYSFCLLILDGLMIISPRT
jgi:hypothetical protein